MTAENTKEWASLLGLLPIEVIEGVVARIVKKKPEDENDEDALFVKVEGRASDVKVLFDTHEVLAAHEGDEIIAAGSNYTTLFRCLAFKNVSQKRAANVSFEDSIFVLSFLAVFAILFFWIFWMSREHWLQPLTLDLIKDAFVVLLFVVVLTFMTGYSLLHLIGVNKAVFLVKCAAAVSLTGAATLIGSDGRRGGQVEVQGRRVFLAQKEKFAVGNGDVLALVAEEASEGLKGLHYRNLSRSLCGQAPVTEGWGLQMALLTVFSVFMVIIGFNNFPVSVGAGALAYFGVWIFLAVTALSLVCRSFYRWRFYREARRRIEEAALTQTTFLQPS